MKTQQQAELTEDAVAAGVAEFLSQNPDFFERHPELLTEIKVPHPCGAAVSLLEHQARVLRERSQGLQRRLDELLTVARDNDRLSERMHALTLELMEAANVEAVLFTLKDALRSDFQVDALAVRLFGEVDDQPDWIRPNHPQLKSFESLLKEPRPICGRLSREQLQFLFGDTATAIGSTALVPLIDGRLLGLLAIGSFRPDRFHPGQGTVFLRQLGTTVGRALRRYLP
jgi:uncharacterized protein YigA (DUF484 family)